MKSESVDAYVTEIGWCSNLEAPVLAARAQDSPGFSSNVGIKHLQRTDFALSSRRNYSSDGAQLMEWS